MDSIVRQRRLQKDGEGDDQHGETKRGGVKKPTWWEEGVNRKTVDGKEGGGRPIDKMVR